MKSKEQPIYVTRPLLPDLNLFKQKLESIWESRLLTNSGPVHNEFEKKLSEYLQVDHLSLVSNATMGLILALKALQKVGEVITTPYTFIATAQSILWNECVPVFCDIDPLSYNILPERVESKITTKTVAVMPVHVYGYPCDIEGFNRLSREHNLPLIYDAAHSFDVQVNERSVLSAGDFSVLSFHATKTFNSVEGGAVVCRTKELKGEIESLKNFCIQDETHINGLGLNAKMSELHAAVGLLSLRKVKESIERRGLVSEQYDSLLEGIEGITPLKFPSNVKRNYSYYPILVSSERYGRERDDLVDILKAHNIFGRRYFYPLVTDHNPYMNYKNGEQFPVAQRVSSEVLCLPIYDGLDIEHIEKISRLIKENAV